MKNKRTWTKWFAPRHGLACEWASTWLTTLAEEGLPGDDFILFAPDSTMSGWINRPAEYHDLRRSLHLMLHLYCNVAMDDAVTYNPHSFRHFLLESAQQLRAVNVCSTNELERLGHWSAGSSMPDKYDNASGVSELQARHRVLEALRSGWHPVPEGALPRAPSGTKSERGLVAHRLTKIVHAVQGDARKTVCGKWTCGTADDPGRFAIRARIPDEWRRCKCVK